MSHITPCRDPGRARIFTELVDHLVQWLGDQQTDVKISRLFKAYLLARGTCTLTSLLNPSLQLGMERRLHNWLGWDRFLEG
jgi:hypothetical protein